jgi:hypothetical protein
MQTYWVIAVKDPGDRQPGVTKYERRFEFDELAEALECAQRAKKSGFDVSAAKVSTSRERVCV